MSFRKSIFLFAFLMALGLFGYRAAWSGSYPLIFVNFRPIFNNEVEQNLSLAHGYYQNALLFSGNDPEKLDTPESYRELKRMVIEEIISRELILIELKSLLDEEEIIRIADRNIEKAIGEAQDLEKGVEKMYGASLADFRTHILLPQAYKEILEGRMALNNQDFSSWLIKTRAESSVVILSPFFEWDGEKVILK